MAHISASLRPASSRALLAGWVSLPQEFQFPDYSDDELFVIFRDLVGKDAAPRFSLQDEKHLRIAARRLGRQRGTTGFGNARAVRNAYEAAQRRQAARVLAERAAGHSPDKLLLCREDLLGPRSLDSGSCEALRELQALRGLAAVKQQVGLGRAGAEQTAGSAVLSDTADRGRQLRPADRPVPGQVNDLLGLVRTNGELEELERPLKSINLNRIFLGNPGTGEAGL